MKRSGQRLVTGLFAWRFRGERSGGLGRRARLAPIALLIGAPLAILAAARSTAEGSPHDSSSSSNGCAAGATRILDIAVNLDADAPSRRAPRALMLPYEALIPNFGLRKTILDPLGRQRVIVVRFFRRSGHEWLVSVGPQAPITEFGETPRLSFFTPEPATSGQLRFDADGELLGPEKIRIELPRAPAPHSEGEDARPDHPEQTIVLRFRSSRGVTTQYANDFVQHLLASDGSSCARGAGLGGPCLLPAELEADGRGGEGAAIFFGDGGRLIADARATMQRIQGNRIDLRTGAVAPIRSDARIPAQLIPPRATRRIALAFELEAAQPIQSLPFDVFDPFASSQWQIGLEAFDRVGRSQRLILFLSRAGSLEWRWTLALDLDGAPEGFASAGFDGAGEGEEAMPENASPIPELVIPPVLEGVFSNGPRVLVSVLEGGEGRLLFEGSGRLAAVSQGDVWLPPGRLPVVRAVERFPADADRLIAIDFGLGTTRLAGASALDSLEQDGYGAGVITSARVYRDHVLEVVASNGLIQPVSELAFASPGDLVCDLACANGRDDDGDGRADYPADPGCASGFDGTESLLPR